MDSLNQDSGDRTAFERLPKRSTVAIALIVVGIALFVIGIIGRLLAFWIFSSGWAWGMLVYSVPLVVAGTSLRFARLRYVLLNSILAYVFWSFAVGEVFMLCVIQGSRGPGPPQVAALKAEQPTAKYVVDFLRLFPGAKVRYNYFSANNDPGYDLEIILYGRYEFTMQLPVVFNSTGDKVVGYGEPSFYLWEVKSVEGREVSYNGSNERHFGSREWKKIVEQNGDFSAIHYEMKMDQPVPGIVEAFEP